MDDSITLDFAYYFKVVMAGDCEVGKSCLIQRHCFDMFQLEYQSTMGIEIQDREEFLEDGRKVTFRVYDQAGGGRWQVCPFTSYCLGASGALLLYDIAKRSTLDSLARWLRDLRESRHDMVVVLVGNKCDLAQLRDVAKEEGEKFAEENGMMFIETSALNSTNVDAAFKLLVKEMCKIVDKHKCREPTTNTEGKCCVT